MTTYLAIGAHIGDMDLTAGPLLAAASLAGHRSVLLALTPGERGHPALSPTEYKAQKIEEGRTFAERIGAEFRVLAYSDGFLEATQDVFLEVAGIVREVRPDVILAHWGRSIHRDHENASTIAEQARFYAGLPMDDGPRRHGASRLAYTENWEDEEGFRPDTYVPIPDDAFALWSNAIQGQAFARGETYGFRYIDYYTALMDLRGCLARVRRASAFVARRTTGREVVDLL